MSSRVYSQSQPSPFCYCPTASTICIFIKSFSGLLLSIPVPLYANAHRDPKFPIPPGNQNLLHTICLALVPLVTPIASTVRLTYGFQVRIECMAPVEAFQCHKPLEGALMRTRIHLLSILGARQRIYMTFEQSLIPLFMQTIDMEITRGNQSCLAFICAAFMMHLGHV